MDLAQRLTMLPWLIFASASGPSMNPYQPGRATGPGGSIPGGGKIPNYLVQAILVTLCCCLPLGIVAIVYAAQVDGKANAGDIAGAMQSSANAKKWCWIAFGIGIVVNILAVLVQVLAGVAQMNAPH